MICCPPDPFIKAEFDTNPSQSVALDSSGSGPCGAGSAAARFENTSLAMIISVSRAILLSPTLCNGCARPSSCRKTLAPQSAMAALRLSRLQPEGPRCCSLTHPFVISSIRVLCEADGVFVTSSSQRLECTRRTYSESPLALKSVS